ncbi:MAG: MG2 domain-containing protein [Candidatus Hydrogenedentes bacterium]|nr:MG2 domain-containing protein [Candidatus Hydrogenedentota bacterium]
MKSKVFFPVRLLLVLVCGICLSYCYSGERNTQDKSIPAKMDKAKQSKLDGKNIGALEAEREGSNEKTTKLVPVWRYPEEGKSFKGEFMLLFPEDIFFPENVNPKDYISITPYREGLTECRGNMLVYTMLEPMPTNVEEIKLCVHPELQSISGRRISEESSCYTLPVKGLKVLEAWFENVDDYVCEVAIRFNQGVDVNELKKFVKVVNARGNDAEWSLEPTDINTNLIFKVKVERKTNEDSEPYKLYVFPGYPNLAHSLKGEPFYLEFPSTKVLSVNSHNLLGGFDVSITFNEDVKGIVLKRFLSLELGDSNKKVEYILTPKLWQREVFFSNRPSENDLYDYSKVWYIYVDDKYDEERDKTLLLTLDKNMWGRDMSLLRERVTIDVNWKEGGIGRGGDKILEASAYWENSGMEGPICVLWANNNLSLEEVNEHISIFPEVKNLKVTKMGRSFRVSGDWKTGVSYILKLTTGMKYGGRVFGDSENDLKYILERDFELFLEPVPEFRVVEFWGKERFYFIPYGEKNYIRVGGRNVTKAYIHVYRVIPENLPYWIGNVSNLNQISLNINERTADYVGAKEVVFNDSVDKAQYVDVNLDELMSKVSKRGLFTIYISEDPNKREVKIESEGSTQNYSSVWDYDGMEWDYGEDSGSFRRSSRQVVSSSVRYFVWTSIGVIAHWEGNDVLGFVHDLVDLTPIVGAEVMGYSLKGRETGKALTDVNGVFRLSCVNEEPRFLVVRALDDFSILFLSPKPLPSMKDLEKYDKFGSNAIEAFVYADRNIYRPGETIHLSWIVKKNYGLEVVDSPLELRIVNPRNRIVYRETVSHSEYGTGVKDIATDTTYLTGAYSIGLYIPGGEKLCGSARVHLEDFVPDRIKVGVEIGELNWLVGNKYEIGVKADYYVGPPGSNLKCEGKVLVYKSEDIWVDKFPGYRFTNYEPYLTYLEDLSLQYTDEQGKTTYSYEFLPKNKPTSPVEVAVRVEVSEKGGRAVGTVKKVIGFPENALCGVGIESVGRKVKANVLVVDTQLRPLSEEEVEVALGTLEWSYVSRIYSSYPRKVLPQWQEKFVPVEKKVVKTVDGKAEVEFEIPESYKSYRVRVKRVAGSMFSEMNFYSMGDRIVNVSEGPPELVKIWMEDKKWEIGEEVPVTIQAPFEGKAFVVVQGEKLWDCKVIELVEGKGEFKLEIKPEYYPNIWVGVSAIPLRLEAKSEISPYSSFAFKNIAVNDNSRKLNVEIIELPESVRPKSKLEFEVVTKGEKGEPVESEITVAIVDEGIHSILGYLTPNPYDWFGRSRYNSIRRAHYYENVAYEYSPESPPGDMIAKQLSAGKPNITESWIKPFALWSGVIRTNTLDGKARLKFDLPEFNGMARVVVVGTGKGKLGSLERSLSVKRPCVIQAQLPRFLRPGDTAIIFARGLNTSPEPLVVGAEVSINGGKLSRNIVEWGVLPNTFESSPELKIETEGTTKSIDLSWKFKIKNEGGNEIDVYSEDTNIPVFLSSRYKRELKSYVVKSGEQLRLDNLNFVEDNLMTSDIWVGGTPYLRVVPVFEWLRGYPYSCAEQKVSKLYGLYILRRYFLSEFFKDASLEDLNNMFISLLNAIFACQVDNGGIGYWQYSMEPDIRVSLHTGFLLASMKRFSDMPIPEKPYAGLMDYIRDLALVGDNKDRGQEEVRAYANMVLALDGDPVACESLSSFLLETKIISWELKVLLEYVLKNCKGDKETFKKGEGSLSSFREATKEEDETLARNRWSFYKTEIMSNALKLLESLTYEEDDSEILALQMQLLDELGSVRYLTTYNLSFALLALEESMKRFGGGGGSVNGEVVINGEKLSISGFSHLRKEIKGRVDLEIINRGESPIFLTTLFSGLVKDESDMNRIYNNNVEVKRYICDKDGQIVLNNELKQGEVYYFIYTILPKDELEGFVLTQLLPAGTELENPRFYDERFITNLEVSKGELKELELIKPEHVEIRDDSLIIACPLLKSSKKVGYICAVRAVTKGEFELPGFFAEDLYNPLVQSQMERERVIIN